jgi:hypothetical protein
MSRSIKSAGYPAKIRGDAEEAIRVLGSELSIGKERSDVDRKALRGTQMG